MKKPHIIHVNRQHVYTVDGDDKEHVQLKFMENDMTKKAQKRLNTNTLKHIAGTPSGGSGEGSYVSGRIQEMAREILEYREAGEVTLFELTTVDDYGDSSSGFATYFEDVAKDWKNSNPYRDYKMRLFKIVYDYSDTEDLLYQKEVDDALLKLTDREKEILGLK